MLIVLPVLLQASDIAPREAVLPETNSTASGLLPHDVQVSTSHEIAVEEEGGGNGSGDDEEVQQLQVGNILPHICFFPVCLGYERRAHHTRCNRHG
jgi:hypothetical protein